MIVVSAQQLLTTPMSSHASISDDGQYRYSLGRMWDTRQPIALFIGLNPSTADADTDDPTLRRCVGFAKREGCGGLVLANLFAYRATDPKAMKSAADPIGPENDAWLTTLAYRHRNDLTIACWGAGGGFLNRGSVVTQMLHDAKCLGLTAAGHPRHPLYLASTTPLEALS